MESVIIAVGSNLGERLSYIQKAGKFLDKLTEKPAVKSSIWESEPVGGAKHYFLNSAAQIFTSVFPQDLLHRLKDFEHACGRGENPIRWGPRVIDLDLIAYGDLVIQQEDLIIPHPEYINRLFVLLPLQEIDDEWRDPTSHIPIDNLTDDAPRMDIKKTDFKW